MGKILTILSIVGMVFMPVLVLATDTVSITPNSAITGNEGSSVFNASEDSEWWLFDPSGNYVVGNTSPCSPNYLHAGINYLWQQSPTMGLATGTTAGNYTFVFLWCGSAYGGEIAACSSNLTSCQSYVASYAPDTTSVNYTVLSTSTPAVVNYNIDNPETVFNLYSYDILYAIISAIIVGVILLLVTRM